ncbi:MAG: MFS transporter [Phycisphaerae bacterium]
MPETTGDGAVGKAIRSYFREFGALRECGRDFWVVQLVNLLDGVAYFAMLTVSTLYLSETLGYDDKNAALLWMAVMMLYTAVGLVAGFLGDSLGIKRTLHLSVVLLVVSRIAISFTESRAIVIPSLFVIAVGTAIMTPILISATKRYTTAKSQTAGFNMLYFLMNSGAFLGNIILDPLRASEWGNRGAFMIGSLMSILCWLAILLFWSRGIDDVDEQLRRDRVRRAGAESNAGPDGGNQTEKKWEARWTIAASVCRETAFWRFMLFLVILIGVRLVFEHQSQVYPKYYQRTIAEYLFRADTQFADALDAAAAPEALRQEFEQNGHLISDEAKVEVNEEGSRWQVKDGDTTYYLRKDEGQISIYAADAPIGRLNSINPFIICIGVILSTPIVARFKLFNVMFVGVCVSAVSMVFLTIYPGWFAGMFGLSLSQGYLAITLAQIIVFSIGELIWSPRLYEYTAAIAPEGREASYMGLSYLPTFFARFSEGPLAGEMLTRYCPPDMGSRLTTVPYLDSPQFMNVILAAIALATPLLILLLRGVIQKEARTNV